MVPRWVTKLRIATLSATLSAALLLVLTAGCEPQNRIPKKPPESQLLVYGGPILTISESQVEAMLIEGGIIRALGDLKTLEVLAPKADRWDLAGQTAMPGVIDSHVHVRELGMDALKANLVGKRFSKYSKLN